MKYGNMYNLQGNGFFLYGYDNYLYVINIYDIVIFLIVNKLIGCVWSCYNISVMIFFSSC